LINQTIVHVKRPRTTDFILQHFHDRPSIIEQHLHRIERYVNEPMKAILRQFVHQSFDRLKSITLRLVLLLRHDQETFTFGCNRTNRVDYRAIALRSMKNPTEFHDEFHRIFHDDDESTEIRLVALQILSRTLNSSTIQELIDRISSNIIRDYLRSLLKQSSLWLGHSGSYRLPFGTINIMYDEQTRTSLPVILQFEFEHQIHIDFYWIEHRNTNEVRSIRLHSV
jgi:hypothetical protein